MVTITGYEARKNDAGETFFVLKLQGEIEMVRSQETGKLYATARQATISSTFDEATCKRLVGTELPGAIRREETEPYEYTIPETGETITLRHTWAYDPEGDGTGITASPEREEPQVIGLAGEVPSNGFPPGSINESATASNP